MSEIRVGVSWVRTTCASNLRQLDNVMVIHDRLEPLAVLIPYELYMKWQELLHGSRKAVRDDH